MELNIKKVNYVTDFFYYIPLGDICSDILLAFMSKYDNRKNTKILLDHTIRSFEGVGRGLIICQRILGRSNTF